MDPSRRSTCFCGKTPVRERNWTGFDAGRSRERCPDRHCEYDTWLEERFDVRSLGAICELFALHMRTISFLQSQMEVLRANEEKKNTLVAAKLREVLEEVERDSV